MSSKKKNAITMIALVVVLIICLVLYFVIPRGKSSDKDADSSRQVNRTQRIPVRTMQKLHWIPLRLITFLRLP